MATVKSTQVTNAEASVPVNSEPNETHGRHRIAYFEFTAAATVATSDIIQLVYLPAGRVRILKSLSYVLSGTGFDATSDLDIGVAAHTDQDGSTAVTVTTDDLLDGGDVATADTPIQLGTGTNADDSLTRLLNSFDRVIVQGTVLTAGATAADTLEGYITYVND